MTAQLAPHLDLAVVPDGLVTASEAFCAVPRALAARRGLLRRFDSKFFLRTSELDRVLPALVPAFGALHAGDSAVATYRTRYFDTGDLRCFDSGARLVALIPQVELAYAVADPLAVAMGYRFAYERDPDGDRKLRHRVHVDVDAQLELRDVELGYRVRWQEQVRGVDGADGLRHTLRNRAAVDWEFWNQWESSAEVEVFHVVGDGDAIHWHKWRITAGLEHDVGGLEYGMFYRLEVPRDDGDPRLHILGVEVEAEL